MHWILQENLNPERYRHDDLVAAIKHAGGTYSVHKVVPFSGDIIPDISPEGPVVVMGPYSLCDLARARGWTPGCWDINDFGFIEQYTVWGNNLLNYDAKVSEFIDADPNMDEFFIRPTSDSKCFAGHVIHRDDFLDWKRRIVQLGENDGSGLNGSTKILWCEPKNIKAEYRLWIVNNVVVTASQYRPTVSNMVPHMAIFFTEAMIEKWIYARSYSFRPLPVPFPAFVMDVCWTDYGWKIVELNTLNACGFYAADIDKLVLALEGLASGD